MLDLMMRPEPTRSLVSLMEQGWAHNPSQRPSFEEIVEALEVLGDEEAVAGGEGRRSRGQENGGTEDGQEWGRDGQRQVSRGPGEDEHDKVLRIPMAKEDNVPSAPSIV